MENLNLVQFIIRCFILSCKVQEQLLNIPVEQMCQVSLQIKSKKT